MQKNPDKKAEEGFVSRWSRLKTRGVDKSALDQSDEENINTISESKSAGEMVEAMDSGSEQSPQTEEAILIDEDMPPIDSLNEDSDYSMFMSRGVSETLRRLALRKLFSGAGFNIRDGLDDYDDDFRNFAALGDIITSDMKHRMEMEEERKRREEEAGAAKDEAAVESEDNTDSDGADADTPDTPDTPVEEESISESGTIISDDTEADNTHSKTD